MNRLLLISLLLLSPFCGAMGQVSSNLVFNPSFEDYVDCPRKIESKGVLTVVEGWYQPTAGSADYYNRCATRECGVPQNKLGYQMPNSGNGYCGIYCSKNEYREYLQTELREPLKAGARYRVSFHVCLSENSTVAVSTIGALFTSDRISDTAKNILMKKSQRSLGSLVNQVISTPYSPQVVSNHILADTAEWMDIGGEFIAEGGELFLTIGNFFDVAHSGIAEYDWLSQMLTGSYYYIDDVSVIHLSDGSQELKYSDTQAIAHSDIQAFKHPDIQAISVGSTLVLHDIYFQFDRSVILQQSYKELTRLLELMQDNPKLRIEIGGHTDDKGSVEYNRKLSESRAKAVADYLTSKGIDPKRLSYRGYGKSKPIEDNSTEEGRSKNRRVEIKVLSK